MAARREARRRDRRLDLTDHALLDVLDDLTLLGYGRGLIAVKALAERLGRSPRTVIRHTAHLECLGYLEITERQHRHGGPAVNRYRVRSPRDWTDEAARRRRRARVARDEARKQRRGVLTRVTRPRIRGRVIAPSGTGDTDRQRPTVPVGQADKREDAVMPMRDGRWVSPLLGQVPARRGASPGRGRGTDAALPAVRSGRVDPEVRESEVREAQAKIAALVARAQAAGRRS